MCRHVRIKIKDDIFIRKSDCVEFIYTNVNAKNDEEYLTLTDEEGQMLFRCNMADIEYFEKTSN
ncbi:hypothetical protein [Aminipila sp.]|uniref:hypothetical protein n=1 Tax=Aminipila sp. TaxID=2060095 RepID=UPI00289BE620|nr:hypothetical protein [Aminipila sp.]